MLLFLSTTDEGSERFLGDDDTVLVIDPFVPQRDADERIDGRPLTR